MSAPTGRADDPPPGDPVRARRRQVARWVRLAKRVGWLLLLAAVALVVAALATGLPGELTVAATVCLVAGAVVLCPAIILGYAVNAAEREDRARGL